MNKNKISVGDKVRLTGKFLKSTGQRTGSQCLSTWIVTAIERDWAITNQETSPELLAQLYTADEIAADPSLKFRRIALANLYKVGQLTVDNCP